MPASLGGGLSFGGRGRWEVRPLIPQLQTLDPDPRAQFLAKLVKERAPVPEALNRIGAFHAQVQDSRIPLRTGLVRSGERYFCHPRDLPELMVLLFHRLHALWDDCRCSRDDLYVAAFAFYGVTAVHPFGNANGRAGIDFAQLLLAHRWGCERPPLALPEDAHDILGGLFVPFDELADGKSVDDFYRLRVRLIEYLGRATMLNIQKTPVFIAAAEWLEQASTMAKAA
jgi:hypothetical protein